MEYVFESEPQWITRPAAPGSAEAYVCWCGAYTMCS
jgi:hypothetical protein